MKATRSAVTHRPEGPGEAAVDGLADGAAGAHLVFEPFEVHHVGVDGDADGHDDAGHPGQGQGQAAGLAQLGDDGVQEGAADGQARRTTTRPRSR